MKVHDLIRILKAMPKNSDVHVYINRTKSAPAAIEVTAVTDNRVFIYVDKLGDK